MNNSDIKIFIVEDNEVYGQMLAQELIQKTEFDIRVCLSGEELLMNLEYGSLPHMIISDYNLCVNGELQTAQQLIEKLNDMDVSIPVVILSGKNDLKTAVEILKTGAFDFIVKNDEAFYHILSSINKVAELLKLKEEISIQKTTRRKDLKRMALLFALTTLSFITILLLK